jgi:hypothetical protein
MGYYKIQNPLRSTHSTIKMTLQFERKYLTQGSGAPCHVSFGFFSGFYGIRLAELQIDPQLESTIRLKARGLHFPYGSLLHDNVSTIEDLQEENSRMLGDYSRGLQDYSRIGWSTFQPWDASSTLEDFWLVVLGDAWELLVKAVKTTRNYPARLQSTWGPCRMDIPRPTTPVGTRTDYSVGPWDYLTCATRHLMAWSARTTVEEYSDKKLYMTRSM